MKTILTGAIALIVSSVVMTSPGAWAQSAVNFAGVWKQCDDCCRPKRTGDVTMVIEQRDAELTVETTILRGSAAPRHAKQRYTTDGKQTISIGADGDEFHTSVTWSGESLRFAVEEHEDGRILLSKETWRLTENGAALERVRLRSNGEEQTLIYRR